MNNMSYEIVTEQESVEYRKLIFWQTMTLLIGSIGVAINVFLTTVFCSFSIFWLRYKLFICLAIGDFFNCLGIALLGLNRRHLFREAVEHGYVVPQTPMLCARKAYVWLRLVGTLWPPATQLAIGADRAACILKPFWHRRYLERKDSQLGLTSLLFVLISLLIGLVMVFTNNHHTVVFYCGRKATFSNGYAFYIYIAETAGYFVALFLSSLAYLSARKVQQTRAIKSQMKKIRYVLALGFLSCTFIALPNIVSMISALIARIVMNHLWFVFLQPMEIYEPIHWLSCINSSLNFFVYYSMNGEFKRKVQSIFCTSIKVASLT